MQKNFVQILNTLVIIAWCGSLLLGVGALLEFAQLDQYGRFSSDGPVVIQLRKLGTTVAFWGAAISFCLTSIYIRSDQLSRRDRT